MQLERRQACKWRGICMQVWGGMHGIVDGGDAVLLVSTL